LCKRTTESRGKRVCKMDDLDEQKGGTVRTGQNGGASGGANLLFENLSWGRFLFNVIVENMAEVRIQTQSIVTGEYRAHAQGDARRRITKKRSLSSVKVRTSRGRLAQPKGGESTSQTEGGGRR